MSTPDLAVEQLVKQFADHRAVDELSFTVERGSFFSILGPSGCGKTTLLRMIAGFIVPDGGTIADRRPQHARRGAESPPGQHGVSAAGAVSDDVGRRERRLRTGAPRRGQSASASRRAEAMLERVGLAGAARKRVDELSGGQRQRVAIARSMVLEPTLLLLDEPLGALDLKLREHMKIELKQLQASFGTTFVYITHDQSEALVLSDHVAVMNRGRFEQLGTPQDLYYQPATAFVAAFVGANNRIAGRVTRRDGELAEIDDDRRAGWCARARAARLRVSAMPPRPSCGPKSPASSAPPIGCPPITQVFGGQVQSLLFDGANSAVLLNEERSGFEFRVALPQTGRLADLKVGERVSFGFDPQRAICFRAMPDACLTAARPGGGGWS